MVCIKIRESGSCQDSAIVYANGYGSLYIYGPCLETSVNQEIIQAVKVTVNAAFYGEVEVS